MSDCVPIIGGGPAGAAAALAIVSAGGHATVYEQSVFPRHKVCGEFFRSEIVRLLESLGLGEGFRALGPAVVTHAELHFDGRSRRFRLPEPACGLSRYAFDHFLLRAAVARGAELRRERVTAPPQGAIWASGRSAASPRGRRVFGFKAHFGGQQNDAVELCFFPRGYCGVCAIEGGLTNVCGLVQEEALRDLRFDVDSMLAAIPRLANRLRPLDRRTRWLITGPLCFGPSAQGGLAAGDAACFVDPFTGTGLLAAVQTGLWAGQSALRPDGADWYHGRCSSFYRRQFATASIARGLLSLGWAETFAGLFPGQVLFRLTRPAA